MSVSEVLTRVWADIIGTQQPPDPAVVWLSLVAAVGLVWLPWGWRVGRHVVTIAHEGAHALVALVSGRRLAGIRVHSDTSGLTVSRGRPTGLGMVLTAFAGYVGPALLGVGGAALLAHGHALAVLWLAVLLLALMLVQIRNIYGLYAVLLAGASVFAVGWWAGEGVQSWAAYTGTWFLLLAAPRPILELQTLRRTGQARGSDADVLAQLTRLPGMLWVGLFLLVSLACLGLGVSWLLWPSS